MSTTKHTQCVICKAEQARARLDAAAPDLLELLSEAERVIRYAAQESHGRVDKAKVGGWVYHADKIRAAIAKAEGGVE